MSGMDSWSSNIQRRKNCWSATRSASVCGGRGRAGGGGGGGAGFGSSAFIFSAVGGSGAGGSGGSGDEGNHGSCRGVRFGNSQPFLVTSHFTGSSTSSLACFTS